MAACVVPLDTIRAIPYGGEFLVNSSSFSLRFLSKVCGVTRNRVLPSSSIKQPKATTIGYNILGVYTYKYICVNIYTYTYAYMIIYIYLNITHILKIIPFIFKNKIYVHFLSLLQTFPYIPFFSLSNLCPLFLLILVTCVYLH